MEINLNTKNKISIFIFLVFITGISIYGYSWWNNNRFKISTDNAYVRSSITTISSRISGYIDRVPALTNSKVEKDEILVIFDTETFETEVKASEAAVEVVNAKIDSLKTDFNKILEITNAKINTIDTNFKNISARMELADTSIEAVTAKAAALSSELRLAKQDLSRIEKLLDKGSVSKSKYDKALSYVNTTKHNLNAASAIIKSEKKKYDVIVTEKQKIDAQKKELLADLETEKLKLSARKKELEASLDKAQAKLNLSIINLESTKVLSPIDGVIANRIAEPGVYVEDGWPLMAVVPIHDIWIIANFKETQVESIEVGQKVSIIFDAFKQNPIEGQVHSLAPASSASFSLLPPQNASGNFVKVVQRVPVKITFDIPEEMLGRIVPGLSAIVSVETNNISSDFNRSAKFSSRE